MNFCKIKVAAGAAEFLLNMDLICSVDCGKREIRMSNGDFHEFNEEAFAELLEDIRNAQRGAVMPVAAAPERILTHDSVG